MELELNEIQIWSTDINQNERKGDSNDLLLHKFKQIDDYNDGHYFTRLEGK